MVWRDPFDEMRKLVDRMERIFEEPWGFGFGPFRGLEEEREGFRQPLTDVFETDNEVVVTVELPGVRKEDIDVTVRENSVEIKAEVKKIEEVKKEGFFRAERSYQGFYRVIPLPTEVKSDQAKATYNNGVLEIRIPKAKPEAKGKKVKVE